jgi:hypothetical protein
VAHMGVLGMDMAHQIVCCLIALYIPERERSKRSLSVYELKRQLSFQGGSLALRVLERLRRAGSLLTHGQPNSTIA